MIVARLRLVYEAFNRQDFDAVMEMAHPDIEFVRPGGQSSTQGAEAVRVWMEPDAFDEQISHPLEFVVEGNRVLVRQHNRARGAGSGIELDIEAWSVWTFNDEGLATRFEYFFPDEKAKAFQAAGIQE